MTEIIFYVNIALMFCVAAEFAALVFACKKTAFKRSVRIAAACVTGVGLIVFAAQLAMYTLGTAKSEYAVYAALAVMYMGLISTGIYCLLLSRRSDRALALASAVLAFVPPLGMFTAVRLLTRMRKDTRAENLIYRGRGYTYAALSGVYLYAEENSDFIDSAGAEEFEELSPKASRAHLKRLKKDKKTPEGCFKYAEALLRYSPKEAQTAVKLTEKAAKRGNADAMFNLGYFNELGLYGVKRDVKRARNYYNRAVEAGDPDAALRLALLDIKTNKSADAESVLSGLGDNADIARFDLALCYEFGRGVARNTEKAIELYAACAEKGIDAAFDRLFALSAKFAATRGDELKKIDELEFDGEFGDIMNGLAAIRAKDAPKAAECFLSAVKRRGKREGAARLFVGTLYIDCGALERDRRNGAAYIGSAVDMTPLAKEVYNAVPKRLKTAVNAEREKEYQKKHERIGEKAKAAADKADADIVERDSISGTEFDWDKDF